MKLARLGFALVFAGCAGCGGTSASNGFHDGGGRDGTIKDSRPGDAGSFPDALFLDSSEDAGPKLGCSKDLRSVVNAKGAVVSRCPSNQGCASGACVPACQAAAAGKSTFGCDFVVATPSFYWPTYPSCFAVFIANDWGQPATIQVSRSGVDYDPTSFGYFPVVGISQGSWTAIPSTGLPPASLGVLFLSQGSGGTNCPHGVAIVGFTMGSSVYTGHAAATGVGEAFHIVTSVPVTAYDIMGWENESFGKNYLASTELLIPTTAWTTNYLGIVPPRGSAKGSQGPQWGQLVAAEDGTTVNVVPNVTLPKGPEVASAPASMLTTFSLNAGQYIQWQDSEEMSGTVISSNHPVGFTGGSTYGCYSSLTSTGGIAAGGGCSSVHQQIPPISAMGHDYVAAPYATRMASLAPESIPYRLVGVVDGTTLTYDPMVAGAPAEVKEGEVVDFESTLAFRVTSQNAAHPFYVGQVMTGCEVTGGSRPGCAPFEATSDAGQVCCLGNAQFVNILPPAQFLEKYVFFADVTYATTNLVFTRVKGPSGFEDVTLDCAGVLTGWEPVGSGGQYEVTNIDLIRAGIPNGACNNGPRSAKSTAPFGITVWGLDTLASYAYPVGGNAAAINSVVVAPTPK